MSYERNANQKTALTVDALAQEIRRVDGSNSLGAGALAEALMPFPPAPVDLAKELEEVRAEIKRIRAVVPSSLLYDTDGDLVEAIGSTFREYVKVALERTTLSNRLASTETALREAEERAQKADVRWRSMETAPLDGKHCILAVPHDCFVYSVQGVYEKDRWRHLLDTDAQPLAWMPNVLLPAEIRTRWLEANEAARAASRDEKA